MLIKVTAYVDVAPARAYEERESTVWTPAEIVRDEVLSNLESLGYVIAVRVVEAQASEGKPR